MTDKLTPTQALALWALLARQGRAKEAEIKPKADRDVLVAAGLAEAETLSKTLSLTDRGWYWATTHFDAPLPPAHRVLQDLLLRIDRHLTASGATLAELIGEAPPLPAPPPSTSKATSKPKAPSKPRALSEPKAPSKLKAPPKPKAAELRRMIEEAYLRVTGGARSEPVRLSRLRAELGDIDRKTVDAGLARIVRAKTETARLSQISDNKAIDGAERDAAFSPADEPFHLIRIQ